MKYRAIRKERERIGEVRRKFMSELKRLNSSIPVFSTHGTRVVYIVCKNDEHIIFPLDCEIGEVIVLPYSQKISSLFFL